MLWPYGVLQTSIPTAPVLEHTGDGVITLFDTHTGKGRIIKYKDETGLYLIRGINELNNLLRCRLTGDEASMSLVLIEVIDHIEDHFKAHEIDIISGYRSPKLNLSLRASGHKTARQSLHMAGLAMDIRIPGVSARAVRDYAKSLKLGGVGYYGNFIHVDVGPVRYW